MTESLDRATFDPMAYVAEQAQAVERALESLLPPEGDDPATIHRAMRYSALGGGKRLRGVLAVAACRAAGGAEEKALPLAAALEMIHAYSLVHDDLPAMDDDDMRRGKPTTHKVFGEGVAVLAGDALLTHAFWVLGRLPRLAGVSAGTALAVIEELTDAAGTMGLIGGQVADLEAEGRTDVTVDHLRSIHLRKTGALFRACVRCGALLAGAGPETLQSLTDYADAFGLAFQIADDILDVTGDPQALGKRPGRDSERAKATYPALVGLEEARRMARQAAAAAREAVAGLPSPGRDVLAALADFAVGRDR